jgi:hypothetical protein
MDWNIVFKNLGIFTIGASSITGIIVYFSKKIFENQISIFKSEHIHRFTTLYSEKILITKEIYKKVVIAEKALNRLMTPNSPKSPNSKLDKVENTLKSLDSFVNYIDENEIFIDDSSLKLIMQLKEKFQALIAAHNQAEFMEIAKGSDAWFEALENKMNVASTVLDNEIPEIKHLLKIEFQARFKLIEIGK